METYITAAIIDTSILEENQFDFIGLTSATLPSFYNILLEKGIILLDHDILHKEISKHIPTSQIVNRIEKLTTKIEQANNILLPFSLKNAEFVQEIKSLNLTEKFNKEFTQIYENAYKLPYSSPEKIFNDYFSSLPPFTETGKKKNEFPDAFIIDAVKNYAIEDTARTILVISKDTDWRNSFNEIDNILFIDSIDEAIKQLQNEQDIIDKLLEICEQDIINKIEFLADCECYEIEGYELIDDDITISDITVESMGIEFIPLKITNSSIVFKCFPSLKVAGKAVVFDTDASVWSSEDREYIYRVNSEVEFENASVDAICEVEIRFDLNDLENSVDLHNIKITNKYSMGINLDYEKTTWNEIYQEDDFWSED